MIKPYLKIVKVYWLWVVGGLGLGLLISTLLYIISPSSYVASIDVYISAQSSVQDTQAAYQGSLLSQQQTRSYAQLVTNPRILNQVKKEVSGVSDQELSTRISASAAPETTLVTISFRSSDPVEASQVVNAVGNAFDALVSDLERPIDARQPPTVVARTVEPAEVPTVAVAPSLTLFLFVGALLGTGAGLAIAAYKGRRSTVIYEPHDLNDREDLLPVLGVVPLQRENSEGTSSGESNLPIAGGEELRRVRTSLQFMSVDTPLRSLVVTSALPAEGKSSVSYGLAAALAMSGASVLLIEADLRKPSFASRFRLVREIGLSSVLSGRSNLGMSIQYVEDPRVAVLTAGPTPPNPSEMLGSRAMSHLLDEVGRSFEYVVVDSPPLLPVTDAAVIAAQVDGAVMVCRASRTTAQQIEAARERLAAVSANYLGCVLNFAPARTYRDYGSYGSYSNGSTPNGRSAEPLNVQTGGDSVTRPSPRPR